MTNTKTLMKALLGATALTVFAAGTAQAQNNFTPADTSVSNTFTLDYKVGGVDQPQIDSSATPTLFTVDRLVDLTVTSNGDLTTAPGATDQELAFSVSNEGNDTQAYDLSIVQEGGDTLNTDDSAAGTDVLVYYVDDGNGTFEPDAADGAAIPYDADNPPTIAPDAVLWVVVTQDIPTTAVDGNQADVTLVADTLDPVTFVAVDADTGGNTLTGAAENVLADETGTSNEAAGDGDHSATGAYIIASADISGVKTVTVYSQDGSLCDDFIETATGGYAIPGACVEYVITVENAGSAPATDIIVNDVLPAELQYAAVTFDGFTAGSFTSEPEGGADCGAVTCEVDFTGGTLPAAVAPATETTGTVTIRAIVK